MMEAFDKIIFGDGNFEREVRERACGSTEERHECRLRPLVKGVFVTILGIVIVTELDIKVF